MTIKTISKRMLSLLMAMLMLCSGMAVAFAADANQVPAPVWSVDEINRTITVQKPAAISVDGEDYPVTVSISPETAAPQVLEDGSLFFYGLEAGKKYTITTSVELEGYTAGSASYTFKTKPATPATPIATNISSTSITIKSVSGCEYKLETAAGDEVFAWGSKTIFDGLDANTAYVVYIRVKETDSAYASDAAFIGVTTLEGSGKKADTPTLLDKTETTITVAVLDENGAEVEGIEYSIDGGKNWQSSGKFTGLTKDTAYPIIARYAFDESVQEANPSSAALQVKTNSRAGYAADIKNCTFKVNGDNYANESLTFVVTGDAPANIYELQYGDTKLIPTKFSVDGGKNTYGASGTDGNGYKFSFVPGVENENSEMEVIVYFVQYKYDGAKWAEVETIEKTYDVEIGPNNDFFNKVKEAFEAIFNFLFNTLPGYINDFLNSGAINDGMNFIKGLLGNLDLSAILGALQ